MSWTFSFNGPQRKLKPYLNILLKVINKLPNSTLTHSIDRIKVRVCVGHLRYYTRSSGWPSVSVSPRGRYSSAAAFHFIHLKPLLSFVCGHCCFWRFVHTLSQQEEEEDIDCHPSGRTFRSTRDDSVLIRNFTTFTVTQ